MESHLAVGVQGLKQDEIYLLSPVIKGPWIDLASGMVRFGA